MSLILLILLIIISQAVIICNSAFQSEIKNSNSLKPYFNIDLSGLKQLNLSELDRSVFLKKISRSTFIQKRPFPQR